MNEELDYAEMLEIPVETMTVRRREKRRRNQDGDLQEQLVEQVNDRMEEMDDDPSYAESTPIAREEGKKKRSLPRLILLGEFILACALVATIFFTNIFLSDSAINTFVRGLFGGETSTADTRGYRDFTLTPVVNEYVDVELAVSDTGVLSFTGKCGVYPPCAGTVTSVSGDSESGYTVGLQHSDSFTTVISGLSAVYASEGDVMKANLPLGFSDGEGEVRITFYSEGNLLNCYTVNGENAISWS